MSFWPEFTICESQAMWRLMGAGAQLRTGWELTKETEAFLLQLPQLINHLVSCCLRVTRILGTCSGRMGTCEPVAVPGRAWCWAQPCHMVWVGQGPVCRGAAGWL